MDQEFDELYVHFWRDELLGARLTREVRLIIHLAGLRPGDRVLDLGAGFGRIAAGLAEQGLDVVAVERSGVLAEVAKRLVGSTCQLIVGDWNRVALGSGFACVLFWFTTLVAGRTADLGSLHRAKAALAQDGFLLVETRHWDRMNREFEEYTERHSTLGVLSEEHRYDPITGVQTTRERYQLKERQLQRSYSIRRYGFPELRCMALDAGFRDVDGFDERGEPLDAVSHRAVLRARA